MIMIKNEPHIQSVNKTILHIFTMFSFQVYFFRSIRRKHDDYTSVNICFYSYHSYKTNYYLLHMQTCLFKFYM